MPPSDFNSLFNRSGLEPETLHLHQAPKWAPSCWSKDQPLSSTELAIVGSLEFSLITMGSTESLKLERGRYPIDTLKR